MKRMRRPTPILATLCAILLSLASETANAIYGFKPVNIESSELQSATPCSIVTCQQLVAYECADSFKIFLTSGSASSTLLYTTNKAVAQVKPSKITSDAFISFIEARVETDAEPAPYAYLRVVDSTGLRDQGISTTFIPNRSIYIGDGLILKVNQAQTNL